MQNDLGILGDGYAVMPGKVSGTDRPELLRAIYSGAIDNLRPFQVMMDIFHTYSDEKFEWERFKMDISRKLVLKSRSENREAFDEKDCKVHGGIYRYTIGRWTTPPLTGWLNLVVCWVCVHLSSCGM